jgi:hypothetical protein
LMPKAVSACSPPSLSGRGFEPVITGSRSLCQKLCSQCG